MKSIVLPTITVLSLTACGEDLSKIEATRHISCKSAAETAWISGYNPKTMTYQFTSKDTKSPEAYKLIHKTELIAAKFREEFRKQEAVAMEKKDYKRPTDEEIKKSVAAERQIIKDHIMSICTEYKGD